jgi:hypothetical protein
MGPGMIGAWGSLLSSESFESCAAT